MAARKKGDNEKRFEELLAELEGVVSAMEKDEPDLERSLAQYERGMALSRECHKRLEEAQRKVLLLRRGPGGNAVAEPLALDEGGER